MIRLVLLFTVVWSLVFIGCSKEFTAIVISVADGDTLTVQNGTAKQKIRLYGIDCPESNQVFGSQAREFTTQLVLSKSVRIQPLYNDPHGRIVARVYLPDNRYVNAEVVSAGFGWWFRKYAQDDKLLEKMEREARAAHRGLWIDSRPIEPWNFRQELHGIARTANEGPNSPIAITYLHCNGHGESEPDEFIELENRTSKSINMSGWILHDECSKHSLPFPKNFELAPSQKCRIYTNLETGCLSFRVSKSAVWNNNRDRAFLEDSSNRVVATRDCDS